MPREPQTKIIDGYTVQVQALPVFKGQRLFVRLLKTVGGSIGPALAALASSGSKGLGDMDLSQHLPTMFSALSPEETEAITRELLTGAIIDPFGNPQNLLAVCDVVFQGSVLTLLKCALFAAEVNFGDFRGIVVGMLDDARRKAQSKANPSLGSNGSPTSGPSGGSSTPI
uniref:Uncharacterized protein n=1 Tax=uncultured bacterium A1Q1_fos_25 TaxID=1256569 RepID=L7W0D2_9BACT|nr:hypothetical protein [uncultured bacterium A1Q1_fos_25]